jgi:SAM-dependent methyltransferase
MNEPEIRGLIVATPNPVPVASGGGVGQTTLSWAAVAANQLEVRVGAPDGVLFARSGRSGRQTTGKWLRDRTTFFLQDVSDGRALSGANTLATVTVELVVPSRIEPAGPGTMDSSAPRAGHVNFGDLRRMRPLSSRWGHDRGRPVDRHYIEAFLASHAEDVRGKVVAIGDDDYIRAYGGDRVTESVVLDVDPDNARATMHADLADSGSVPADVFDCCICPQTLQYVYDVRAAVRTIHRMLKPGGVALVTLPGISPAGGAWGDHWCWSFTPTSARRLFCEEFPEPVDVNGHGNALVATAFLMGVAGGELTDDELDHHEPGYAIVITVRAVKPKSRSPVSDAR